MMATTRWLALAALCLVLTQAAPSGGAVRFVPRNANEKAVRATITPSGNDPVVLPGAGVK